MDHQDYFEQKEEELQARKDRLRFAAGMSDFVGVILGVVVILLMLLLIFSLVSWLRRDITNTFTFINNRF
ncbi:MAG: hypothetical protein QM308_07335 [Bacillota bacterium]|nr:hypothetical protein [Bacillota bacterium]